jgi:hypothetical protein
MLRERLETGTPARRAAALKLPVSSIRQKYCIAFSLSIIAIVAKVFRDITLLSAIMEKCILHYFTHPHQQIDKGRPESWNIKRSNW